MTKYRTFTVYLMASITQNLFGIKVQINGVLNEVQYLARKYNKDSKDPKKAQRN